MLHYALGMDFPIHTRKDTYNMSTHTIEMTICQSKPRSGCYICTICPVVIFARALHNDLGYTHENVAHCSPLHFFYLLLFRTFYYCDTQTNEAFSCFLFTSLVGVKCVLIQWIRNVQWTIVNDNDWQQGYILLKGGDYKRVGQKLLIEYLLEDCNLLFRINGICHLIMSVRNSIINCLH